jgi:anti-sigma B factor antagonist
MNVNITTQRGYTVISIHGRIDTISAGDFEASVLEVIEKGSNQIILDCTGLDYISSSGLRVFLLAQKKVEAMSGRLKLCNMQAGIKEIFDISGFSTIFAIYPDLAGALGD